MGVGFGLAVGADIPMDVEIGDHAAIDELGSHEFPGERDALLLRHLAGNGELDLAGELRIPAFLGRLNLVPQHFAIAQPLRRALRQHDLGVDDAGLVGEVVVPPEPLVMEPLGRPVGGGRHGAPSTAASDDLGREMVDRHDGVPFTPDPATSVRRISTLSCARARLRDSTC